MSDKRYVFGYGSVMNPASAAKDVNPSCFRSWVMLVGYQRIFNAPVDGYLALNIEVCPDKSVEGMLFEVDDTIFASFVKRERGYDAVDITEQLAEKIDGRVFAFSMPPNTYPHLTILQSYFDLCTSGVPASIREAWIQNTVIENSIVSK